MSVDLPTPETPADAYMAPDLVILSRDEWANIRISLRHLVAAKARQDRATDFDIASAATAEAVDRRRHADAVTFLDSHGTPPVKFALYVRPDATDSEMLIAARRALAAGTEAVTA